MIRTTFKTALIGTLALAMLAVVSLQADARPPSKNRYYVANRGVQLTYIAPGSAAARAGLEVNDIIVSINGTPMTSMDHLVYAVRNSSVAQMDVINNRDGQHVNVTAFPRNGKLGINGFITDVDDAPYTPYSVARPYSAKKIIRKR